MLHVEICSISSWDCHNNSSLKLCLHLCAEFTCLPLLHQTLKIRMQPLALTNLVRLLISSAQMTSCQFIGADDLVAQRGEEPLMQLLPPASPPRNEIVSAPGGR